MKRSDKVKVFQLVTGCDLIGSKMSMAASKNLDLTLSKEGIYCFSKASQRLILIPWTNIKGAELLPEVE